MLSLIKHLNKIHSKAMGDNQKGSLRSHNMRQYFPGGVLSLWRIHIHVNFTGAGRTIIEGANIHIFVFTDCKNNLFQKKLIKQKAHI